MSSVIPKKQREVVRLLEEGLSIANIAKELSMKVKKVYELLGILKIKGIVENPERGVWRTIRAGGYASLMGLGQGEKAGGELFPSKRKNWVRYHNVMITIGILEHSQDWDRSPNSIFMRNQPKDFGLTKYLELQGYEVSGRIFRKSVVIQLPEVTKETTEEAEQEAMAILFKTLRLIEQRYKLTLIKDSYLNMRINKQHYALIHNELAETYKEKKETLKIYWKDGKLRLTIDFSRNALEGSRSPELEATHPQLAPDDIMPIKAFFEEFVDNPFMPKDIKLLQQHAQITMSVQEAYAEQIKQHLKVQRETLKTLKEIRKESKYRNKARLLDKEEYSEARKQAELEKAKSKEKPGGKLAKNSKPPASDLRKWF